jgi:triosephosphate isomerase (TIM)
MEDVLIINFKTYKESTGKNALKIVKAAERAHKKGKGTIILVPQTVDLRLVAENTKLPVFAQHTDTEEQGGHTGSINIDALKEAGAKGILINHSEKRLSLKKIEETIKLCKKKKMKSVVCTKTLAETKKVLRYKPDYVAVEPPELIGGTISISEAKPKLIQEAAKTTNKIKILCGAGIHREEDVRIAKQLGSNGILVASGVIKAKNTYTEILSLLKGFS